MPHRDQRHLPPFAGEALEIVKDELGAEDRTTRDQAENRLVAHGFEPADAAHSIEYLLARGHLYSVNGELFVTPE